MSDQDTLDGLSLTIGPIIAGGITSVGLSAIVGFQTLLYFLTSHVDSTRYRTMVAWIWLTDAGHTISVCISVWQYGVVNFANPAKLHDIVPSYPVNIILTLVATLNANIFYTWRIHKMSKRNWWLTAPIIIICIGRTVLGLFVVAEMFITKKWAIIGDRFPIPLILAWTVSAFTDVVISVVRYYYLRDLKQGYVGTKEMVDAVVIFTINDGLLSSAGMIAASACFLSMSKNFIWIGIYFNVAKLFSNSVLATLNLRNWYRHRIRPLGIPLTRPRPRASHNTLNMHPTHSPTLTDKRPALPYVHALPTARSGSGNLHDSNVTATMEVFVDHEVEYTGKYVIEDTGSQA